MMQIIAPRTFYKFVSLDSEEKITRLFRTLEHGEIYFSAPSNFNDPFDCRPELYGFKTKREQLSQLKRITKNHPDRPMSKDIKANFRRMTVAELELKMRNICYGNIGKQGVLCLAGNREHPLMWSHYADSHRGAAIGLTTNANILSYLAPVRYSESRGRYFLGDKDIMNLYHQAFFFKADFWDYEDEHRIIAFHRTLADRVKAATGMPRHLHDFIIHRNGPGTYQIGSQAVVNITFGSNIDTSTKRRISNFIQQRVPHIALYSANTSPVDYKISFRRER